VSAHGGRAGWLYNLVLELMPGSAILQPMLHQSTEEDGEYTYCVALW